MPAEAQRLQHRITGRDRRAISFMLALSVLAAAILIAVSAVSRYHDGNGCLRVDQAGVMGGGTWRLCGNDAKTYCTRHAGESEAVDSRCAVLRKSA